LPDSERDRKTGRNEIVICDRFSDATISYQGYGGGVCLKTIKTLDNIATGGLTPDLTILLDIDTSEGLRRARKKGIDRMESKEFAYHRRVRTGYLELAGLYPGRIRIIKTKGSIPEVHATVRREAEFVIHKYKRPR
jgi:dTMP kinase